MSERDINLSRARSEMDADTIDALRAEVERLRAYLPLARATDYLIATIRNSDDGTRDDPEVDSAWHVVIERRDALTPEQRRALMENK